MNPSITKSGGDRASPGHWRNGGWAASCTLVLLLASPWIPGRLEAGTPDREALNVAPPGPGHASPTLAAVARAKGPTEARAFTRRLPQVRFADATLEEALEYLRLNIGCDPEPGFDLHVNIVQTDESSGAKFALDLTDLPFGEALRYCAEMAHFTVTYRDHAAIVHKPGHRPLIAEFESPLMSRAKAIVVPRVQFIGVTVAEAVELLRRQSVELDPLHRGINIVLTPGTQKAPDFTLNLALVPLSEVLCYVAVLTKLKLAASGNALVFSAE